MTGKTTPEVSSALERAREGLLRLQQDDGRFEGQLTSNAYPTLACALIDRLRDKPLDPGYLGWLQREVGDDGRLALDPEGRVSDEATRFARVVMTAFHTTQTNDDLQAILKRIPLDDWNLWLVKVFGALAGQFEWRKIPPPKAAEAVGRVAGSLIGVLPRAFFAKLKPPQHLAPPVSLFSQPAFEKLFVAEQYTLAPILLIVEAHTRRREKVMRELLDWVLARQAFDGSWFCVAFITAIATMALMVADESLDEPRIRKPLERALAWLETTRNPDGGHREAISLNVWDTSLSALALMRVGVSPRSKEIRRLAEWLVEAQNHDGGWAFHSVRGSGLPSDADDTALATQTLLRSGRHPVQTERGIAWLLSHQGKDGSWATYVPEIGDVGCVSVTSNAIHTLLLINERVAVGRAVEWLCRSQANDGSWSDLWLAKRTYGTSKALVALAHVGVKDEVVRRGLALLASIRHEDGGWGETQLGNATASTVEQTAFVAQALRAHRQDASSAERLLLERQREDGGWTASPIGIYWEVIGGYANPINAWVFPMLALSEGSSESAR